MVGAVGGAGELCSCCEDVGTDAFDGEVYASGGVEEVQARIEDRMILFTVCMPVVQMDIQEFQIG
jgi:hypothetical protein